MPGMPVLVLQKMVFICWKNERRHQKYQKNIILVIKQCENVSPIIKQIVLKSKIIRFVEQNF